MSKGLAKRRARVDKRAHQASQPNDEARSGDRAEQ